MNETEMDSIFAQTKGLRDALMNGEKITTEFPEAEMYPLVATNMPFSSKSNELFQLAVKRIGPEDIWRIFKLTVMIPQMFFIDDIYLWSGGQIHEDTSYEKFTFTPRKLVPEMSLRDYSVFSREMERKMGKLDLTSFIIAGRSVLSALIEGVSSQGEEALDLYPLDPNTKPGGYFLDGKKYIIHPYAGDAEAILTRRMPISSERVAYSPETGIVSCTRDFVEAVQRRCNQVRLSGCSVSRMYNNYLLGFNVMDHCLCTKNTYQVTSKPNSGLPRLIHLIESRSPREPDDYIEPLEACAEYHRGVIRAV